MKKVIFISNFLGHGGAAQVIVTLAEALANCNYNVKVCSFSSNFLEYELSNSVEHVTFEINNKNYLIRKLRRIKSLRSFIKKNKDAVIISFEYFVNIEVLLACVGLKNRIIVSERNDPSKVKGFIAFLRNCLYKRANVVVCQTNEAKDYFSYDVKKRIVVIPNPIKADLPKPYSGDRDKTIVNFCRLNSQKNLPLLIDSFIDFSKLYKDYSLHIYGDGPEKSMLINYIENKNVSSKVFIHDWTPNIHLEILRAGMFVSSSDFEGLSNSMIEAMAIGLPVICTDCPCGGAKMVIDNGVNGILVPIRDRLALTNAMISLASNEFYAKKIGNAAFSINQNLSKERVLNAWIRILVD